MVNLQEQWDHLEAKDEYNLVQAEDDRPMLVKENATYQDVIDAPFHLSAELLNGRYYLMRRPRFSHAHAAMMLGANIGNAYMLGNNGPGGWKIYHEPEVHLIKDIKVFVPDRAGWREHSWHQLPEDHKFTVMPDWICEVLSPTTRKKDLELKFPEYALAGIPHLWHIDPDAKTLAAYQLQSGSWQQIANLKDNDAVCVPPFDAISFSLTDLWV